MLVTGSKDISADGRLPPPKPHPVGSEGHLCLMILNMRRAFWMLPRLVLIKTHRGSSTARQKLWPERSFVSKVINNPSLLSFSKWAKIVWRVTIKVHCFLLKEHFIDFTLNHQSQFSGHGEFYSACENSCITSAVALNLRSSLVKLPKLHKMLG